MIILVIGDYIMIHSPHEVTNLVLVYLLDMMQLILTSSKTRRRQPRTVFSSLQIELLEEKFSQNSYISKSERKLLTKSISLDDRQIKVWFQNRRAKNRRFREEETRN